MITVGAFEAKNHLSQLLAQVEKGQHFIITRRGEKVAMLSPVHVKNEHGQLNESESPKQDLLSRLREFRRGVRPGSESVRELIDDGRTR